MPDKPQPWFTLPRHALVTLAGRDALAFAQAQFMGDVRPLQPGQWHWNGWLTPKGRVLALFALLVRDPETAWLVLHDSEPDAFATALRRYVFRSKVTIEAPGTPIFGSTSLAAPTTTATGVELDVSAEGGRRTLRIGGEPGIEDPEADSDWARFDLLHGLPRLPASQLEQWTPQQLSLERLRAYSVAKGCYPGQEIVARTHFLGKAKRGLVLLEGDTPIEAGSEVRSGERALGTVVCAEGNLALAVMPLERDGGDLAIDGHPIRERPLQGGLARP